MDILDLRDKKPETHDNQIIIEAEPLQPSVFSKFGNFIWEIIKIVVVSLAIIVPVRMFVIQPFIVEGASMEPNFENGQYLIVDEISYRFAAPVRGEVVIFHPPYDTKAYYIKRIIALPGEALEIKGGDIYIYNAASPQGFKLSEDYLTDSRILTGDQKKIVLGANEYYLIGDNRTNSLDSRKFGPVKFEEIRGRALFRAYPFSQFTVFKKPNY